MPLSLISVVVLNLLYKTQVQIRRYRQTIFTHYFTDL